METHPHGRFEEGPNALQGAPNLGRAGEDIINMAVKVVLESLALLWITNNRGDGRS